MEPNTTFLTVLPNSARICWYNGEWRGRASTGSDWWEAKFNLFDCIVEYSGITLLLRGKVGMSEGSERLVGLGGQIQPFFNCVSHRSSFPFHENLECMRKIIVSELF